MLKRVNPEKPEKSSISNLAAEDDGLCIADLHWDRPPHLGPGARGHLGQDQRPGQAHHRGRGVRVVREDVAGDVQQDVEGPPGAGGQDEAAR